MQDRNCIDKEKWIQEKKIYMYIKILALEHRDDDS